MLTALTFLVVGLIAGSMECIVIFMVLNNRQFFAKSTWFEIARGISNAFSRNTPISTDMFKNFAIIVFTAGAFWLMGERYYYLADEISACLIVSFMIIVLFTVTPTRKFPGALFVTGFVIAVLSAAMGIRNGISIYMDNTWWNPVLGGVLGFGLLLLMSFISAMVKHADSVSFGDIKFMGVIGIMLGWRLMLEAMILIFAVIAIEGIVFRIFNLTKGSKLVVFAPVAVFVVFVILIWGENIFRLYSGTFT
jgi:prepilin signal peptidase PulO-like enzyme (type II secretory pathway)